ncbi:MAG: hypothetical protein CMJ40_10635 [Phycisphaerae bacterium]|nr:hypothetical protein [Phycisphaerae bacterium]|tara:strand:+ start:320 stop:1432 length:1113 start_codon:yes stop_codon:yes gene_type:complete
MNTLEVLATHDVDPTRGFLPAIDPIDALPDSHRVWEQTARIFDTGDSNPRESILAMPTLDASGLLDDDGATRRAMLLLSVIGSGYVQCGPLSDHRIPACISLPWKQVSDRLGRPMIVSHASIVLDNWGFLEGDDLTRPETLRTMARFAGGSDEDWFYLVTVSIEAIGASLIPTLVETRLAVDSGDASGVASCLDAVTTIIERIRAMLNRMEERCRPPVFYQSVRPYLSGWPEEGIIYDQVHSKPVRLFGGSAAQSSLLQAIDAAMGITHQDERSAYFLDAMRDYMPPSHRSFIEWFENGTTLRESAITEQARRSYDKAIDALDAFRRDHMAITARYITQQGDPSAQGTGGTEYGTFLRVTRRETTDQRLD